MKIGPPPRWPFAGIECHHTLNYKVDEIDHLTYDAVRPPAQDDFGTFPRHIAETEAQIQT